MTSRGPNSLGRGYLLRNDSGKTEGAALNDLIIFEGAERELMRGLRVFNLGALLLVEGLGLISWKNVSFCEKSGEYFRDWVALQTCHYNRFMSDFSA